MDLSVLIALILLLCVMVSICAIQFSRTNTLRKEYNFLKMINAASAGGYYCWRKSGNIEEISNSLSYMLKLRPGNEKFIKIAEVFGNEQNNLLTELDNLKNGTATNMRFTGLAGLKNEKKEIQCIGCSILNENNNEIIGVILWFFDISEYLQKIKYLTLQNTNLTKEIKDYSGIFNSIPIPIWKRGADFHIKFCNFVYSKFVGNEDSNISSQQIPELDQSLLRLSAIARGHGRPLKMKKHLVIQGERKFYNIVEMAVKNSDEIFGFAYDITDQDEIEKELARHISAHANLLESSSSAIAVYGADTKLRFYNNAFVNLWGIKVKWLDTNPTYGEILEVLRKKRKLPEQADFKQFRKDQMMLFQHVTKTYEDIMHLPNGKSIRIIVIPHALGGLLFSYEDITDRLAMEHSFNTLIAVQRETLDNLSEGVALFDENGKIRLYNPVYVKMWNEDAEYLEQNPSISDIMERSKNLYNFDNNWKNFKEKIISDMLRRKSIKRRENLKNGRIIDMISRPLPNGDTLVSFVDVTTSINFRISEAG